MSGDVDAAESLRRALAAEEQVETAEVKQVAAEVVPKPNPFIAGAIGGLVAKGLLISKQLGWSSPAAPPLLTEEEWKANVTHCASIVIARRFPRLNDEASEEFVLLVLLGSWIGMNMGGMLWDRFFPKKKPEAAEVTKAA
jgi:hypothetical protein